MEAMRCVSYDQSLSTVENNFRFFFQQEAWKWTNRGFCLFQEQNYYLSELCASVALHFNACNPYLTTRTILCRAVSRYELGNIQGTLSDADVIKGLDKNFATVRV